MKKLFYVIIAACSLFAATSCGDKDEANNESLDGRWDVYTPLHQECQSFTFIFDGNKVDAYIIFWAQRLKGTYTYVDNKFEFNFDSTDSWLSNVDDNYTGTIDDSVYLFVDPETLKPVTGFTWEPLSLERFTESADFLKNWEFERESNTSGHGGVDGSYRFVKK